MVQQDIIYFDIAAVVVIAICLLSFLMRRLTRRPETRVFFTAMVLVLLTAIACLGGEIYDYFLGPFLLRTNLVDPQHFETGRSALTLLYYALRVFTAPAYLVLIATVSGTTYRMNNSLFKRIILWVPMIATLVFVLTNPFHHLVYYYEGGVSHRGPCILVLYAVAAYYCAFGIGWLIRWRSAFDNSEFSILMMLYPFMFIAVYIQYYFPYMRVDMFATAVAMLLISAFVIPPEKHVDTHMRAANLLAYRERCRRAFLTQRPLCLVYVQMVNLDQMRELMGQEQLQDLLGRVSEMLSGTLAKDDVLYYLRNGLFCIIPWNADAQRALEVARAMHEEGKARAQQRAREQRQAYEQRMAAELRQADARQADAQQADAPQAAGARQGDAQQAAGAQQADGARQALGALLPHEHRGQKLPEGLPEMRMRTCVVRMPDDVADVDTLRAFVRRFAHLVPESCVTTYEELSKREGFDLEMALSDVVEAAIANRSFEVHYQPIYCLADGRFHSAEALVRLNDPTFGWVPPGLFIPEAEQNGTIVLIGRILIQKICAFLGALDYERTQLHYVEVNLSVDQCVQPGMAQRLLGVMRQHGVPPERMNLEITETSAAYSQQIVERNVRTLADAGLTFSLDDYGTGYSNVSRAVNLPISLVKLDKSLVDGLGDPAMHEVVARTVSMMKAIGKDVLAEGVESREQVEELRAMGVDYIQGYYFAKPLPEPEFVKFLEERNA